jgi:hypothetical protein
VIPLIIVTALFIKKYILLDKKHHVNIKEEWIKLNDATVFQNDKNKGL